jgi:hypothetical protein
MSAAASAEFTGHQSGEDNRDGLCERGEEAEANQRGSEECQRDAGKEGCDRGIGYVPPGEVARVIEGGQLIAMETVSATGKQMDDDRGQRNVNQNGYIARPPGSRPCGLGDRCLRGHALEYYLFGGTYGNGFAVAAPAPR